MTKVERQKLEALILTLTKIGWSADDLCLTPNTLLEDLEALVHELAHSVVAGGVDELHKPKSPSATAALVKTRKHQNRDELLTTAVTILVCEELGADIKTEALESAAGNISPGKGKYDLPGHVRSRFYDKTVKEHITSRVDELMQTKVAQKRTSQLVCFLKGLLH